MKPAASPEFKRSALVHRALQELIERAISRALAALGGTSPKLRPIPRRHTASHH